MQIQLEQAVISLSKKKKTLGPGYGAFSASPSKRSSFSKRPSLTSFKKQDVIENKQVREWKPTVVKQPLLEKNKKKGISCSEVGKRT